MSTPRLVALILISLVAVVALSVGLIVGAGYLLFGSPRDDIADQLEHAEARRVDERLAQELATRWKAGQPFALGDIVAGPMARTCLETWLSPSTPARELARRSQRPWWWRGHEGNSTLAIERPGGGVTAYRIKSYGWQTVVGRAVIRFDFEGRGFACARQGGLRFRPLTYGTSYLFAVSGD